MLVMLKPIMKLIKTPAEVFDPAEPAKAQMAQYPAPSASDEPESVSGAVTVFYYNIDEDRDALKSYSLHVWNKAKTDSDVDASKVQSVETNGGSDWANTSLTPVEVNDYGAKFVLHITEDDQDVFYFIYGVLHSPDYRRRFEADLKKSLARIPLPKTGADFSAFVKAGRKLGDLHCGYEKVKP